MCRSLHVKYPLFLSYFNKTWISSPDFGKILKYEILWKSVQWEPSCSMRTDRLTDGRTWQSLIVAFRNFVNAPKKWAFIKELDLKKIVNCSNIIFIVVPCILITLKFLAPTNASLYYTCKMLKCTVKISYDCSYMFRSTWTIIREPMPNLAKVTILWK